MFNTSNNQHPAFSAPSQLIQVVVPVGANPGNQLLVTSPYNPQHQFQVTIPDGYAPGMSFNVQLPVHSSGGLDLFHGGLTDGGNKLQQMSFNGPTSKPLHWLLRLFLFCVAGICTGVFVVAICFTLLLVATSY